jgi:hypothetical protein
MTQAWEESVKFTFGHTSEDEYYVNVPGLRDDEDCNIEDGCHTMERYNLPLLKSNYWPFIVNYHLESAAMYKIYLILLWTKSLSWWTNRLLECKKWGNPWL